MKHVERFARAIVFGIMPLVLTVFLVVNAITAVAVQLHAPSPHIYTPADTVKPRPQPAPSTTTVPPTIPTVVTTPKGLCPQEDSCAIDYHDGQWFVYPAAH